nr:chitin synthase 1 [Ipomoea batatas]
MFFTSSYTADSDFDLTSFKISFSTSGCRETTQKNHVSAADVVSRPASIKLITISITKFSSEWPELKNLDNQRANSIESLATDHNSLFKSNRKFRFRKRRRRIKNRNQAVGELRINHGLHELPERSSVELVAGDLSLELPALAVGVKDPVAEKIIQNAPREIPFPVDRKAHLEDVLNIQRVRSEHYAETQRPVKGERQIGSALNHVGNPLKPAVLVLQQGEIRTD